MTTIPTIHNRKLKRKNPSGKYILLLTNQIVIIGFEFDVMRVYRAKFSDKKVDDMLPTKKNIHIDNIGYQYYNHTCEGSKILNLQGPVFITTLSDFIESN